MIDSKTVIDNFLTYIKNNTESYLTTYESVHSTTIDRAIHVDNVIYNDLRFPFVVVFEENTTHEIETLRSDLKSFRFKIDIVDQRADLTKCKNNLYSYRFALENMIELDSKVGNDGGIAMITNISMPPLIKQNANYGGMIEIDVNYKTVNE